jgi:transcriptional regulatory protein RtcR
MLFLDEIGELGLDEQAMLLRALEEKKFLPLGADAEVSSAFQLIAGTNRDLGRRVARGEFREDLMARINLWTFGLPALKDRPEDIEPNIEYELEQFAKRTGRTVRFTSEARKAYVEFAVGAGGSGGAAWTGNFRDLAASITRMATLSPSGRIAEDAVVAETARLSARWDQSREEPAADGRQKARDVPVKKRRAADVEGEQVTWEQFDWCAEIMGHEATAELDRFDRVQLNDVLGVCSRSRTISVAGRELFAVSREKKASKNDADRLRKYLARFGLNWEDVRR